eukprot:gene10203-biopygen2890
MRVRKGRLTAPQLGALRSASYWAATKGQLWDTWTGTTKGRAKATRTGSTSPDSCSAPVMTPCGVRSHRCEPSLHACSVGPTDGVVVGAAEVGIVLGDTDGLTLGEMVGEVDGTIVGLPLGDTDGDTVGAAVVASQI